MTEQKFQSLVSDALDELPESFKRALDNVDVVVEKRPSPDQLRMAGSSHRNMVLGLYQGVPLSRRSHHYGMVMPDKISIFKKNILGLCSEEGDIKRVVRKTVRHEIAHHFGINDKRLRDLGVY